MSRQLRITSKSLTGSMRVDVIGIVTPQLQAISLMIWLKTTTEYIVASIEVWNEFRCRGNLVRDKEVEYAAKGASMTGIGLACLFKTARGSLKIALEVRDLTSFRLHVDVLGKACKSCTHQISANLELVALQ
jgi:hypothetical protein